uniref:Fe2OG dioxygenase domain-containing protein n=1 Tax=Chromera velia CCMP2878 TaxID=1169474 RepID=A0A0G4I4J7_9ALVE|mmetsp:Transcript_44255/g.87326  ORF Transcript_44255/g.87326 Transcript_44255/m.87326 type:complete len:300 (+) Transcript_44255:94-993(+)|eukprot:Cvel_1794.t1-p1 / transcript=Cvel_1794.t1 / gene=Cvel_1794 / organism=Chromera_velia_CCMP2878 / gene_product=Alpha-ketoglutarate-dependent dioxygenase alkB, putative / transcript_product=Alpha-ketoglutarate-dependent dioxygenase alkB, putative / location=Cvel_scaffold66:40662-41558(-) / protein_length=299 / sequence_SO=supercontig / SO=protein_coding / is_pseudo=false
MSLKSLIRKAKHSYEPPVKTGGEQGGRVKGDGETELLSLQPQHLIRPPSLPPPLGDVKTVCVVENFTSEEGEKTILSNISSSVSRFNPLRGRRTQVWGGQVTAEGLQDAEKLPQFLETLAEGLVSCGAFQAENKPNHVLVNEYEPGGGIMPHTDGPAYFPQVAILSLGSSAVFVFGRKATQTPSGDIGETAERPKETLRVFLPRRSLLLFSDDLYTDWLHSLPSQREDCLDSDVLGVPPSLEGQSIFRETRVSLTVRHVPAPAPTQVTAAGAQIESDAAGASGTTVTDNAPGGEGKENI